MKNIGREADRIIREKRLKKKDVAAKVGITTVYLSQIFKKESIDAYLLEKLSKALNIPIAYWFDESNNINKSVAKGEGSAASIYGNATAVAISSRDQEIENLKLLLQEKERTIQILMNNMNVVENNTHKNKCINK